MSKTEHIFLPKIDPTKPRLVLRLYVTPENDFFFLAIKTPDGHQILLGRAFCFFFEVDYGALHILSVRDYTKKNFFFPIFSGVRSCFTVKRSLDFLSICFRNEPKNFFHEMALSPYFMSFFIYPKGLERVEQHGGG